MGMFKIESRTERLGADGGVLLLRESWKRLGMFNWLADRVVDVRDPKQITHPIAELLTTQLLMLVQEKITIRHGVPDEKTSCPHKNGVNVTFKPREYWYDR